MLRSHLDPDRLCQALAEGSFGRLAQGPPIALTRGVIQPSPPRGHCGTLPRFRTGRTWC